MFTLQIVKFMQYRVCSSFRNLKKHSYCIYSLHVCGGGAHVEGGGSLHHVGSGIKPRLSDFSYRAILSALILEILTCQL